MQSLSLILLIIAAIIIAPAFRHILSQAETIGLTLILAIIGGIVGHALTVHLALPQSASASGLIPLSLALGFLGTSSLQMLVLRYSRHRFASTADADSSMLCLQVTGLIMSILGILSISLNSL